MDTKIPSRFNLSRLTDWYEDYQEMQEKIEEAVHPEIAKARTVVREQMIRHLSESSHAMTEVVEGYPSSPEID